MYNLLRLGLHAGGGSPLRLGAVRMGSYGVVASVSSPRRPSMGGMAKELSIDDIDQKARELLDRRIASVRTLVTARQALADLREQVAEAEREDVRLYNAALSDGWSADELRKLGLAEPEKKA